MAVGQTPPGVLNGLWRPIGEPPPELLHERRLPDTRVADQRDDVRLPLLDRVVEDRLQQPKSVPRPTKARAPPRRPRGRISVSARHERLRHHRLGLALRVDRECRSELERAVHRFGGSGANDGRARRRRLLEPRGDVDRVPGDERAAHARLPCDDLAGVHADAELEPPVEHRLQALLHGERGVQGPLSVVLERLRDAEDGHHRVAGELLDVPRHGRSRRPSRRRSARAGRASAPDPPGRRAPSSRRGRREHSGQLALGGLHLAIVTGARWLSPR